MPDPDGGRQSPADCFDMVQEAWRIATRFMTPVIVLTDGYLANGSEPWQIPDAGQPDADRSANILAAPSNGDAFHPYERDERLARPWALPGTPGLMHRIGGLEKQDVTGNVNYEPENHQHMVNHARPQSGWHRPGYSASKRCERPGDRQACWC